MKQRQFATNAKVKPQMHINATYECESELIRNFLGQIVFKVAAVGLDTSVKMSSPLLNCRVNHSLVKFGPCRHNTLTQ